MTASLRTPALLLAALLALPSAARATIVLPVSIEEMAKEAVVVVRGKVVERRSDWDQEHRRIYTTTTLEISETLLATQSLPKQIKIRALGGEVGEVGMKVAGTPEFSTGDDVVLFLRTDPIATADYQVIGMSQGKYTLRQAANGATVAVPNLDGLAFARQGPDGVMRAGGAHPEPSELTYDQLKARIRAGVAAAARPSPAVPTQTPTSPARVSE